MVTKQTAPIAWTLLSYELSDAQDGLESLLRDMAEGKAFNAIDFQIHMMHIYRHLNRAWNGRNATDQQWQVEAPDAWNTLPTDLNLPSAC